MSNAELQVCRLSLVLRSRFKKLLLSASGVQIPVLVFTHGANGTLN